MKKSLTRKLTIAVIALVFAVVSLSTSTYAWFTMSNTAQVDPFTAEVKAGEGIEIAVTSGSEVGNAQWYTGSIPGTVVEAAYAGSFEKFDAFRPEAYVYNNYAQTQYAEILQPYLPIG